jgi:type II secretion system protein G
MVMFHRVTYPTRRQGFTIVELLIVIVVIGILAAITIVSYNGVQNRAYDVSVQNDLVQMTDALMENEIQTGEYPTDEAGLSQIGLKVSKTAYGNNFVDGSTGYLYNALYCSTVPGYSPSEFAIISASRSGNVFSDSSLGGGVQAFPTSSWTGGWGTMCPAILNVTAGNSSTGIWLYENSIWKVWLG